MSFDKNRRREKSRPPCDEFGPDDGIDPRILFRNETRLEESSRVDDHKLLQLCSQAARALQFALSGQCNDPLLQSLDVVRVTPAPDARRLRVVVCPLTDTPDLAPIHQRLAAAHGLLRSAVATSIRRRKAPELTFLVIPEADRHGEVSS